MELDSLKQFTTTNVNSLNQKTGLTDSKIISLATSFNSCCANIQSLFTRTNLIENKIVNLENKTTNYENETKQVWTAIRYLSHVNNSKNRG